MNIPRFAVNRKSLVLAALVLALFWSIAAATSTARREDPVITQRQTEIVTIWPGATTENIEQLVTKKVADDIRGVAHVDHVEGNSRPGISDITVVFDDAMTDANPVLRDVRNHVDDLKTHLPAGIVEGPTLVEDVWKTYPIVLGISVDGYSARQTRDFAKLLKDDLSTLPDVGLVKLVGEQEQSVDVNIDMRKLSDYGVGAGEVIAALGAHNAIVPNGSVAAGGRIAQVDPSNALRDQFDVANVTVAAPGGRAIRVGDVAEVRTGYPDPPTELVHVDGKRGVALAIQAKDTSSVTTLGPQVREYLAKSRARWPAGVNVTFIADQPSTVSDRVNDFWLNLFLAVIMVTGLVALFMGLRNGLLVGVTVAISIVLTLGVMPLLSIDINQISLLALIISLGIIVDAGIVAIDNIEHHLRAGRDRTQAAWQGVQDLWLPLLTSTLVAMSSFLPFRLMGGSIGDFVRDLAVVTCISLSMSLLVAYFITPIIGEWFAVAANAPGGNRIAQRIQGIFDGFLARLQSLYVPVATASLHRPIVTVGIAGVAVLAAVMWIPHLGVQFFPLADRNQFFIAVNAPDGTDVRTTEKIVASLEALLAKKPGVTAYGAFIGQGAPRFYYNVLAEQPKPSYAQILVDTVDVPTANRLVEELRGETAARIVGARIDVKRLEQGPPVGSPIQIRLAGEDARMLAQTSTRLQSVLASIPGTASVRDSLGVPTTKLSARIDEDRAGVVGVSDASVQQLVSLAFGGVRATEIREADRQTPVIVRLPEALRGNADTLAALGVRGASGASVPLGEIATLEPRTQTSIATLRDGLPTVTLLADVQGRLASDVLADFKKRAAGIAIPAGVRLSFAGEDEQTTKSFRNLAIALGIGLLINQTILLWEFRLLRLSMVVLAAVPLGLVGAVFGLAITGNHFGFVASLGISSLGGIVTNHAIVLFEYAKRELEHGVSMEQALINAGTKRLRPIMLTVVASVAGLLPLAFSSQTLWRPFCWAVIFGLTGSMLMTLVAIPAIYRLVSPKNAGAGVAAGNLPEGPGELALTEVRAN